MSQKCVVPWSASEVIRMLARRHALYIIALHILGEKAANEIKQTKREFLNSKQ